MWCPRRGSRWARAAAAVAAARSRLHWGNRRRSRLGRPRRRKGCCPSVLPCPLQARGSRQAGRGQAVTPNISQYLQRIGLGSAAAPTHPSWRRGRALTWRLLLGWKVHLEGRPGGREALVLDEPDEIKPLLEVLSAPAGRVDAASRVWGWCTPVPVAADGAIPGWCGCISLTSLSQHASAALPSHKLHCLLIHHRVHHILAAVVEALAKGGCTERGGEARRQQWGEHHRAVRGQALYQSSPCFGCLSGCP